MSRATTTHGRPATEAGGVDASADLLDAARGRGLTVRELDGHALDFDREFDAVFSNAALHWMTRPSDVVAGVARALKSGGRFVAEFGVVERIELIPRPTRLPTGIEGWLRTFRAPFFEQYPPGRREGVLADVIWMLQAQLRDEAGDWTADYVRLRVRARLEAGAVS